jgi:hypothetical protein
MVISKISNIIPIDSITTHEIIESIIETLKLDNNEETYLSYLNDMKIIVGYELLNNEIYIEGYKILKKYLPILENKRLSKYLNNEKTLTFISISIRDLKSLVMKDIYEIEDMVNNIYLDEDVIDELILNGFLSEEGGYYYCK